MQNFNIMDDFSKPQDHTGIIRWMWWLYLVVGCFIVCLLIWMFSVISENQAKYNNPYLVPQTTEQIAE